MTPMLTYALYSLLAVAVIFLVALLLRRKSGKPDSKLEERLQALEQSRELFEQMVKEEIAKTQAELTELNRQLKEEMKNAFASSFESILKKLAENSTVLKGQIDLLAAQISALPQNSPTKPALAKKRETAAPGQSPPPTVGDANAKARRLARLIVSDIALYNRKSIEEGVRNGNFEALMEHDIREARLLYARRIPEEIRNSTTYLDDAFAELIAKTKQEMKL